MSLFLIPVLCIQQFRWRQGSYSRLQVQYRSTVLAARFLLQRVHTVRLTMLNKPRRCNIGGLANILITCNLSAIAPCTVYGQYQLVIGNAQFWPTLNKTPQLIDAKIGKIDCVGKTTWCARRSVQTLHLSMWIKYTGTTVSFFLISLMRAQPTPGNATHILYINQCGLAQGCVF